MLHVFIHFNYIIVTTVRWSLRCQNNYPLGLSSLKPHPSACVYYGSHRYGTKWNKFHPYNKWWYRTVLWPDQWTVSDYYYVTFIEIYIITNIECALKYFPSSINTDSAPFLSLTLRIVSCKKNSLSGWDTMSLIIHYYVYNWFYWN